MGGFATQFMNYHIAAGLMKIKKKEYLSLKQGSMSVNEYCDRFIQLSRYAPDEVAEDERKQEHFIEGINGPLQYALVAEREIGSNLFLNEFWWLNCPTQIIGLTSLL
jgi:hypothetical protein